MLLNASRKGRFAVELLGDPQQIDGLMGAGKQQNNRVRLAQSLETLSINGWISSGSFPLIDFHGRDLGTASFQAGDQGSGW